MAGVTWNGKWNTTRLWQLSLYGSESGIEYCKPKQRRLNRNKRTYTHPTSPVSRLQSVDGWGSPEGCGVDSEGL
jgi:hypothetical protein